MRVGGLPKIPEKGVEQKGGETKILKRGQAGPRGGCLNQAGNPLQTMAHYGICNM